MTRFVVVFIAVSGVLAFASTACRDRPAGGEAAAEGGAPSSGRNEAFCTLLEAQYASLSKAQAQGDFADPAKRKAYFTEQKEMNAKILAAAPKELESTAALQVKNSNAACDAQLAGDRARSQAASAVLASKENVDASARMRDYCGIKAPGP
jgi:hypothetical protein